MNADQVKELLSNITPGPWAYRFLEHDDWGMVRDSHDRLVARARATSLDLKAHRAAGTDPSAGNAALIASAPAVAQWALERDAEVARLREALAWVAHLLAKAISEDVEGYYTNEMGRTARAALEGTS